MAGGAVLAQVWGLALGMADAYAAAGEPVSDLVSHADTPALLSDLTGTAAPVLDQPTAAVGQVLQGQIRGGGLPLPGQATSVPDAFAIAAVLVPGVPPQSRTEDDAPRASRSGSATGTGRAPSPAIPAQRTAEADAAPVAAAIHRDVLTAATDSQAVPATADQQAPGPATGLALAAATPAPAEPGGPGTAVLVPIAAGLLLTGAAMYKHRGLPGGH